MQVEQQKCQESIYRNAWEPEPCDKPAKFEVLYLFQVWPLCGIHARRYRNRFGAVLKELPRGDSK